MSIVDYEEIIKSSKTIYVFGVTEDGTPYLILNSEKRFKPRVRSEGYVKAVAKPPLILMEINVRQYRVKEEIKLVILPMNEEIKRFIKAMEDNGKILLSLTDLETFREVYMSVAEKGFIEEKDYDAITFEIPIEGVNEITQTINIIDIVDKGFIKKVEEALNRRQMEELNELDIIYG